MTVFTPSSPRRLFFTVLALTTLLKVWLAIAIPFIGDEAYFYQWGAHVDWGGFYDHPPMAGWWLWALQQLSSHPLVLRLPAIALWIVITFGMMDLLPRLQAQAPERRWLLGSLFLLLPFSWGLNLITTDTPLIFFLFFSGYAFVRAELADDYRWYAAAGVLLGLALLSKYFAGLLAIAYAVYLLPRRGGLPLLLVVALCALPFMLLNLAWNATHCWNNILFNLMNRNQGAQFSLSTVGIYVVMMIYLVTPWMGWQLLTSRGWRLHWRLVALFAVPFTLFLLLSFWKSIGLHWVLAFLPFVYLVAGLQLSDEQLERARRWVLWLGRWCWWPGSYVARPVWAPALVQTDWVALPPIIWITLVYAAVAASALTFVLLQYAALRLPSAKVMAYTYLTPSWVILWEIALGKGAPPALVLGGVALSITALALLLKDEH